MIRSRGLSYALLVASLWLPLYMLGFLGFMIATMASGFLTNQSDGLPAAFIGLFAVHGLTMLLSIALIVVYCLDVAKHPGLAPGLDAGLDGRVLWILLVVLTGSIGQLLYWWLHLRPGSESFERRLAWLSGRWVA